MGTTACNLHLLAPALSPAGAISAEIERAYRELGYVAPSAPEERLKRVVLKGGRPGSYLSVYDSDNDQLDSGELADLAARLSQRLATVAILASVYDSDAHAFRIYYAGRQVDSDISGESGSRDGPRALSGKKRYEKWREIFSAADPAGIGALAAEEWRKRLAGIGDTDSVFAEARLSQWCRAAGLDPSAALSRSDDFDAAEDPEQTTILLTRGPQRQTRPAKSGGAQEIAYVRSDDDARELLYFPAAWPAPAGKDFAVDWNAATSGPGFRGLGVSLTFERTSGVRLISLEVVARPFFNGQLMSLASVAHRKWNEFPESIPDQPILTREATDFEIPAIDPETRKKFLVTLRARFALVEGAQATVSPTIEALDGGFAPLSLPPIRLRAPVIAWKPLVGPCPAETVARLNQPSVATFAAILPDAGPTNRARVKAWFDAWIASLLLPAEMEARVQAQKHMTGAGNLAKSTWTVPAGQLAADKRWRRVVDAERDYQSVTIEFAPSDAPYAVAGAIMQGSLREPSRARPEPSALARQADERLAAAVWFVNEPSVYQRFGVSAEAEERIFSSWLAEGEVLQAWTTASTWLPEFGDYKSGPRQFMTLYETAVRDISHPLYRGPQFASLAPSASWPTRRLRFVGPRIWLGEALASELDLAALAGIAVVRRHGGVTEIALDDGAAIADLERALKPILPSAEDILPTLEARLADSRHGLEYVELGVALMRLAETESGTEKLARAVEVIRMALAKMTRQSYPLGWAAAQTPLGVVLLQLAAKQPGTGALEAAVNAFEETVLAHEEALRQYPHRTREDLAGAKAQLAIALVRLGDREAGGASCERALIVLDDARRDLELAPIAEGQEVSRALLNARIGVAWLDIAERRGDAALASTAFRAIEGSLEPLRRAHFASGIEANEAQVVRARQLIERLGRR